MRIGHGYDSHRFAEDRPLVLGGVRIADHEGLGGHSDGDAVIHALIDALLGAAGLGSIGELFPDTDPEWEGAASTRLLRLAVQEAEGENFQVVNADVTIVAESPRISEHGTAMAERLAELLHVHPDQVNVKGKTNEALGWIGRGEGIAVMAVILLDRMSHGGQDTRRGRPGR